MELIILGQCSYEKSVKRLNVDSKPSIAVAYFSHVK